MYDIFKSTFFYRTPPEADSGRCFWIRPLFVDRATSDAYRSLVLEMKEIEIKKNWICTHVTEFYLKLFIGTSKAYDHEKECS